MTAPLRPPITRRRPSGAVRLLFALALAACLAPAAAAEQADPWQRLAAGGHVIVMRHALAPGTGDPADFALGDCATQRNLSAAGREQARRIGAALREQGVRVDAVMSSRWCRCTETAALLGFQPPRPAAMLDSFFRDRSTADAQTRATRALAAGWSRDGGNLVLVTHQVNITALTGVYPASGEMVVLAPGEAGAIEVLGSIAVR